VLKSHSGWKTKHFRGMTLEEIREKFIPIWKQIKDFVPMASKEEGERVKRKGLRLEQESAKKMKISEEVSEEDLKEMMQLVPVEEEVRELIRTRRVLDTVLFPPPPAQVYSCPKKDMSWTRLPEFADDTITNYIRPSPSIESNSNDLQNSNSSISDNRESSSSIMSKPMIKFVKAADSPKVIKTNKVETARKSSIRYA
nr:hypothetical protein [Tanacetum cinerariifolium]